MQLATKTNNSWKQERRREQNAKAQQRSRARRKALEKALSENSSIAYNVRISTGCRGKTQCERQQLTFIDFLHYFPRAADILNVTNILIAEGMDIAAVAKYGLISMGYCLEDSVFESRRGLCFACWCSAIEPLIEGQFKIDTVMLAGAQVFSRMRGPAGWSPQVPGFSVRGNGTSQSDPPFSAFVEIGRHIGVSVDQMADDDAVSPFITQRLDVFRGTDLEPVPEQVTIVHHPYIDLIPLPSFRTRVLQAIARGDRDLDEQALCFDMMLGGLQCHGSTQLSLHGRGEGTPWDARSWEVTPWFLHKWANLVGDENDIIYRNSAWWWARHSS
ncbi:hypothetical protein BJX70DRAFT_394466 [Aspergillus crustosus]